MKWQELIRKFSQDYKFQLPATREEISSVESVLGVSLPQELRELLHESNGVEGSYDLGLIWNAGRIEHENLAFRQNLEFRNLYMPFDSLMFFADAGNGDQFAFSILNGEVRRSDIFVWNHEDDSRQWVAPSLEKYLEWWLEGKLKI